MNSPFRKIFRRWLHGKATPSWDEQIASLGVDGTIDPRYENLMAQEIYDKVRDGQE